MMIDDEKTADICRDSGTSERLAVLVAGGLTVRDAAAEVGVSERVAYGISPTAEFRKRVASLRSEMTSAAVGELSSAACEAVQTIRQLLADTNEPAVRLNAAKAILNALGPLSELAELRERLDALERGE